VIADKAATKEKYIDWGILADPNWKPQVRGSYRAFGGRAGYTGGGLTRTVAPDSGPMSQGLRSLYINDRDY
jgi:hypothetical protein